VIKADIVQALTSAGFRAVAVDVLSPPWSSDWISAEGRRKLAAFGIAPPAEGAVNCPRCQSPQTTRLSEFGSTPCKALYRCDSCLEPFDHFKCI
jgi:ring-1,2-phenylacetyl-CoA epoxidase subunit PaaD